MPTEELAAWLDRVRALRARESRPAPGRPAGSPGAAAGPGGPAGPGATAETPARAAARPGQLQFTITRLGPPPARPRRGRAGRRSGR